MTEQQLFNQNTAITYWHKHRFPAQPPEWTLARYNDDVHLYDMGARAAELAEHRSAVQRWPVRVEQRGGWRGGL